MFNLTSTNNIIIDRVHRNPMNTMGYQRKTWVLDKNGKAEEMKENKWKEISERKKMERKKRYGRKEWEERIKKESINRKW